MRINSHASRCYLEHQFNYQLAIIQNYRSGGNCYARLDYVGVELPLAQPGSSGGAHTMCLQKYYIIIPQCKKTSIENHVLGLKMKIFVCDPQKVVGVSCW